MIDRHRVNFDIPSMFISNLLDFVKDKDMVKALDCHYIRNKNQGGLEQYLDMVELFSSETLVVEGNKFYGLVSMGSFRYLKARLQVLVVKVRRIQRF